MQDNVDLNTRLLAVTDTVALLTQQLNANATAVEDNDKRVKEVIVTVAGKPGQSNAVFDNLQKSARIQRTTTEDWRISSKGCQGPQPTQHLIQPIKDPFLISKLFQTAKH